MSEQRVIQRETLSEKFDRLAALFRRDTGMMAPGKDVPAALGSTATYEERSAAWQTWLADRAVSRPAEQSER